MRGGILICCSYTHLIFILLAHLHMVPLKLHYHHCTENYGSSSRTVKYFEDQQNSLNRHQWHHDHHKELKQETLMATKDASTSLEVEVGVMHYNVASNLLISLNKVIHCTNFEILETTNYCALPLL